MLYGQIEVIYSSWTHLEAREERIERKVEAEAEEEGGRRRMDQVECGKRRRKRSGRLLQPSGSLTVDLLCLLSTGEDWRVGRRREEGKPIPSLLVCVHRQEKRVESGATQYFSARTGSSSSLNPIFERRRGKKKPFSLSSSLIPTENGIHVLPSKTNIVDKL